MRSKKVMKCAPNYHGLSPLYIFIIVKIVDDTFTFLDNLLSNILSYQLISFHFSFGGFCFGGFRFGGFRFGDFRFWRFSFLEVFVLEVFVLEVFTCYQGNKRAICLDLCNRLSSIMSALF